MTLDKIINHLDGIWYSKELIQSGINSEPIFDHALSNVEASIDNIILKTDYVIRLLVSKNPHNINRITDYYTFAALGVRYLSQFGAINDSAVVSAKFGRSFQDMNWPSEYPFRKKDILIAFIRSIEASFNVLLLSGEYDCPINLNQ